MANPFTMLLVDALQLYLICVVVWAILSTFISFKIINAYQPLVSRVMFALDKICEPAMKPIRKVIPDLGGIDISPILVILFITFLQNVLLRYFA